MTLRMGDGPVANLPAGLDAYAGYVDDGGDGVTWPGVLARFPDALHLPISVHGAPADCADVEKGAMGSWRGYTVGYCAISNAAALLARDGRPPRLWTAHHNDVPHICTGACWPGLPAGFAADGTQWTDHGGAWDESLLADDFFGYRSGKDEEMTSWAEGTQRHVAGVVGGVPCHWWIDDSIPAGQPGHGWQVERLPAP